MVHGTGIQGEGAADGSWVRRSIAITGAAVLGAVLVSCAPAPGSAGPAGAVLPTPSAGAASADSTSSTAGMAVPTAPKSPREQTVATPASQPVAPHVVKTSSNTVTVLTGTYISTWKDSNWAYTQTDKWYTPVTTTTSYYSDGHRVQGTPTNGKPFYKQTFKVDPIIDLEHPIPIAPATGPPQPPQPPRVDPPQPTAATAPMPPR